MTRSVRWDCDLYLIGSRSVVMSAVGGIDQISAVGLRPVARHLFVPLGSM